MVFLSDINIDFSKYRICALSCSGVLMLISILLVLLKGICFGTDFAGGIIIELRADQVDVKSVNLKLQENGFVGFSVQGFKNNDRELMVRFKNEKDSDQSDTVEKIKGVLNKILGEVTYLKIDYVGPQVGYKQIFEGLCAIIFSLLGMFLYLWVRFQWRFALGGVLALIHDVVLTLGLVSLCNIEFNLSSTAAILTVIGYSVNDSVVIYDRIRELLKKKLQKKLSDVINISINATLSRTILTSGTTMLASVPLMLLCQGTVRELSIIVFFGIAVGTYSSIFIATTSLSNDINKT
ncbi:protein-export membrane protein SecF [Ehrlichia chaffeensis str. Arkansas]|uniref:Protein-export membrane protein SecF n=1 Tax=Ehrlichia chaffeensis (strain ATCC CRL-10679 / Arkansas) TaxID=205920 RepID=Q2GI09_EHRCR|nr:protein translocase subunit SecF [Ehrlichia chaffeensis]ABD45091.1 protein-export membrane protein SecF [Ehrlichia chaffeensis str. Arkansas]AHX09330.1 protein-export membrane protein SecF [Ehrlichia chaffeensis str. Wakulla]